MLSVPRVTPWENFTPSRELMDTQLFWAYSSAKLSHGLQPKAAETCPNWLCLTAAGSSAYMEPTMGDWALPVIWGGEEKHLLTQTPFFWSARLCRRGGWGWQGWEWDWEWKCEATWEWGPAAAGHGRRFCGKRTFYIRNGLCPWRSTSAKAFWYMKGQIHWLSYICAFWEISVNSRPGAGELGTAVPHLGLGDTDAQTSQTSFSRHQTAKVRLELMELSETWHQ